MLKKIIIIAVIFVVVAALAIGSKTKLNKENANVAPLTKVEVTAPKATDVKDNTNIEVAMPKADEPTDNKNIEVTMPKAVKAMMNKPAKSTNPKDIAKNQTAFQKLCGSVDKRLKLTPAQSKLRKDGVEETARFTKPLTDKIKAEKAEIEKIQNSDLPQDIKTAKKQPLYKEIHELDIKVGNAPMAKTAKFEASLNPSQKAELAKIKEELAKYQN